MNLLLSGLREDALFIVLLSFLVLHSALAPNRIATYASLVDWPTIATLTGLLMLTKGLEVSGALHRLGHMLIRSMATERTVALSLVLASAVLSTVLTNDVALFVVVPLTLGACRLTKMPATKLIVFEALAVNSGSALTPIGNPQNLFLWQLSKVSLGEFVGYMLPLVALMMGALIVLTACAFSDRPVCPNDDAKITPLDRPLLSVSLVMYLPFLVAADQHHASAAVGVVFAALLMLSPRTLFQVDWKLLLVFVLMFIDLRLVAGLPALRDALHGFGLDRPTHLYFTSIGASQIVSNVPATIALAEYSNDWRVIAYGVNIGGFGLMIGSLANLIALRLSGDSKAWLNFHAYAIPALFVAAGLGYALLFGVQFR